MAQGNYRLIDVDALDPDAAFPAELLTPRFPPAPIADVQAVASHCRQSLQRGEQEGALRTALENVPYGADEQGKVGLLLCLPTH
jgi:actin related protein 2/3 complex subunit 5